MAARAVEEAARTTTRVQVVLARLAKGTTAALAEDPMAADAQEAVAVPVSLETMGFLQSRGETAETGSNH